MYRIKKRRDFFNADVFTFKLRHGKGVEAAITCVCKHPYRVVGIIIILK